MMYKMKNFHHNINFKCRKNLYSTFNESGNRCMDEWLTKMEREVTYWSENFIK